MTKTLGAPIVVREAVPRKAGLRRGDQVEFRVSGRVITIMPKAKRVVEAKDTLTAEEVKAVRRGEEQLRRGESVSWRDVKDALAR